MAIEKRLDVTVTFAITDAGKPFNSTIVAWEDVPYAGVLELQKRGIAFLTAMNEFGFELNASASQPSA